MKTFLSLILSFLLVISAGAQTNEFITNKDFQAEKKKLNEGINSAKKSGLEAKKILTKQDQIIDSLSRVIKDDQTKLASSNDSILSLTSRVNDLHYQVDQKRTSLRSGLIFGFGTITLLVILLFIWIFMIKKKSGQNFSDLSDSVGKTNNKLDQELNHLGEEIRGNKELIKATSDELNQQVKSALEQFEIRAGNIEQQFRDNSSIFEGKITKSKEENEILMKKQEEKLNMIQTLVENKYQELTALINSAVQSQKSIEPGFIERVNALKTQLEQKIQSVSAEISKLRK